MSSTKQTKHSSSFLTRRAALTKPPGTRAEEMKQRSNEENKQRKETGSAQAPMRFRKGGSI